MKKLLLIAGLAILTVSCSEQENVQIASNNAIDFNTYVGKTSRADVTSSNLQTFYVYGGYNDNSTVFNGTTVTKTGTSWKTADTKYWVIGETYNFAAVAPEQVSAVFDLTNLTISDYTPGDNDLVVALSAPVVAKSANNAAVQLNFQHALAKVQVSFLSKENDDVTFTVSNIKLENVANKGTLTAIFDAGTSLEWANASETGSYDYNLTENKGVKYLLPQDLTDAVVLSFSVEAEGLGSETVEKSFSIPVMTENVTEWEMGHAYNYTINLWSAFEIEEIEFDVVDAPEWSDNDFESNVGVGEGSQEPAEPSEPTEPELLTASLYVDFGNASTDNTDAKWNHFRSAELSEVVLNYEDGETASPVKISATGFSAYAGAGGESNDMTSSNIEWPLGVWRDAFLVTGSNPGVVTLSGLNPDQKYNITVLSVRFNGGISARQTHFTINGQTAEINQGLKLDSSNYLNWESVPYDNFSHLFENVAPSQSGTIEISVVGTPELASSDGHFNGMVVTPVED